MTPGSWIVAPDKFLNSEQVQVLRNILEGERLVGLRTRDCYAVRNAAIVELLLGSGLRASELCALIVSDLFLDRGAEQVLVRRGKGGKTRLVAISERLATYLAEFVSWKASVGQPAVPTAPVFLSERGGPMHRSAVHRVWKAALERAGLPTHWGVHATRHSYAVEVYRRTRDLRLTQRLLGHSSPVVTQVYASLLDDDVRRGVESIWAA